MLHEGDDNDFFSMRPHCEGRDPMKRNNAIRHVIVALSIAIVLLAGVMTWVLRSAPENMPVEFGTAFTLTDDNGQPITEKALSGHPSLIYFGFTRCPEVCPTTLYEMSGWFNALGNDAKDLNAFFFSVDPERDTPELMHNYSAAFTDRIVGITGDPAEMQKVMKSWRIFARKVPTEGGDYTMDHTASVLMLDSRGNFKGTISYGEAADSAIAKIRELLKSG